MRNFYRKSIVQLLLSVFLITLSFSSGTCSEIDDSAIFVEAFNAYQQKDYLLTIEKCDQLNQVFPDSPLKDVTLLLIARASLKSGENDRAAKTISIFSSEFPESNLKSSIEDELNILEKRHKNGEVISPNKTLQAAARKVRNDRIAHERELELKLEAERAAKAKAEMERLAEIKREEERVERERLEAEKLAKASIKAAITVADNYDSFPVGSNGTLPFEISNSGTSSEEFLLAVNADKDYRAALTDTSGSENKIERMKLDAGETFKGFITFRMPTEMVDGHRSPLTIKAVSARFSDVGFNKDAVLITSAPLVRAVAKLAKQKVVPGESIRYKVTVINVGSLTAQNLTVRLKLPSEIEFQGAPDALFKQESNGTLLFRIDSLESGKLSEINMNVKIRKKVATGKQIKGDVEVFDEHLNRKEVFSANASVVVTGK
ncbi:MAG: hypothetical protein PHN84_10630 [Desulfuromonadaceae bacterium]|nr:hypothetical protein [Desulfuromonadaceae bacterium]MDD2855811.1 hypothetical protein [Desulfuromonadaceae bacterium]